MGLTHKLFLAILIAAGLAVISAVLIMQWSVHRGFLRYVDSLEKTAVSRLAAKLEQKYSEDPGWHAVRRDPALLTRLAATSMPEHGPHPGEPHPGHPGEGTPPVPKPLPPPGRHRLEERVFLMDAHRSVIAGQAGDIAGSEMTPLKVHGRTVGYLGVAPRTGLSDPPQQRFLREQKIAFALVAAVVVLLSAGLSLLMARRLVKPLRVLAAATHHLAAGKYATRVPATSDDELGRLGRDFNELALALEKNERARRRWIADISHELRTPLAVLRGEVEALQDGVRQPTAETIHSIHADILRLSRLIDDLYQLSLSDAGALTYRKEDLDLEEVLAEILDSYRQEFAAKEITICEERSREGKARIFGDRERLQQLFSNLLDNVLKYTDPGGRLEIRMDWSGAGVVVDFQDSAPGVPADELEKLFERLYRVDSSRNRSTGGAGLGLAICRNIAEAHAGSITACPSLLGGVWIRLELPKEERR
ncbi:MAG: ATP-binding protein [Geobacteraceae bacterium]|nr:ATP-binding protein [Geobacteraceae bacterium]